jgi:N-acetylglucosaminyldiphosphoundecaprenol N-acetyl-beta-D-mannosaminyltransferase
VDDKIDLMGLRFDSITMNQCVDKCVDWCKDKNSARTVMTINAALLVMMRDNQALARANRAGDLVVADGLPVVWASRIVGTPLVERVAGIDLMQNLLARGDREKLRFYFLGAKQEVLENLLTLCSKTYPNLVISGTYHGYFNQNNTAELVDKIRRSNTDILFIGMPSPFKEIWGQRNRDELGVSVIIGVGGSFDVIAGYVKRSPKWMQKAGLEWLWRLMMEPRKLWKRYLVYNTRFIYNLVVEFFNKRFVIK